MPLSFLCPSYSENRHKLRQKIQDLTCTSPLRCRMASSFSLISSSTVLFSLGVQHKRQEYLATKDRQGTPGAPNPPSPRQLSAERASTCRWTTITSSPWSTMTLSLTESWTQLESACVWWKMRWSVWDFQDVRCCECAKRASVGESEQVLAQSNVWETESEKQQMAASPMEGGRAKEEERWVMTGQATTFIICAHPLYFIISFNGETGCVWLEKSIHNSMYFWWNYTLMTVVLHWSETKTQSYRL